MTQAATIMLGITAFILLIFVYATLLELKRRQKLVSELEKDLKDYVSIVDALKIDRDSCLNSKIDLKRRVDYLETILAEIKGIADVD